MAAYTVTASTIIEAPVEEVFEKTANPHNGPIFIPNLNENHAINPEHTMVGQTWEWRYNFLGVDIAGTAEVTDLIPHRRWSLRTGGGVQSEWTYTFEPADDSTRVALSVSYDMPASALGKVTHAMAERTNQQSCEQALKNLKSWIEP